MWGNKQGWIISAVIVIVTGLLIFFVARPEGISSPSHTIAPEGLAVIGVPVSPASLVPHGAEGCDAGDLYRRAIEAYQQDPKAEQAYEPLMVQAIACGHMTLFSRNPGELINYDNAHPSLENLVHVAEATNGAGLLLKVDQKYDEARKYFEAVFVLGNRLYEERVCWAELVAGLGQMEAAARSLEDLAQKTADTQRATAFKTFREAVAGYRAKLQGVYQDVGGIDESYAGKHAGDIFAMAQPANPERMWRVEAIKHLGLYRWNATRRADQLGAPTRLKAYAQESDPLIQTAAKAALALTQEKHNRYGTGVD